LRCGAELANGNSFSTTSEIFKLQTARLRAYSWNYWVKALYPMRVAPLYSVIKEPHHDVDRGET
jgi:hypothetical protein